ncbi:hypothetical protein JCM8547_004382 [Rhodosporidiobolus lusitaniae]
MIVRWGSTLLLLVALVALSPSPSSAFYLPGTRPVDYSLSGAVPLLMNALGPSTGRQGETDLVTFDAVNDHRLPFCPSPSPSSSVPLSLGSALFGDRIHPSPFQLEMAQNKSCQHLCTVRVRKEQSTFLTHLAASSYSHNWLVDGLPVAQMVQTSGGEVFYEPGFPVGEAFEREEEEEEGGGKKKKVGGKKGVRVNNHFTFVLDYHYRPKEGVYRVVSALVVPKSVNSLKGGRAAPSCDAGKVGGLMLDEGEEREMVYTYDVVWRASSTPWSTRWDTYLRIQLPQIHVLSLINSLFIAVFLGLLVAMVLVRVLNRDITRYNALASYDLDLDPAGDVGVQEDYGWKLLHGEVFRPPKQRMWLCIAVGIGAQTGAMCVVTLLFALLGFLSPSNRGALSTLMIVCWTLFGFIAGYVSSRLYLSLNGEATRKNIVYTGVVFPSVLFAFLFTLNFFLIGVGSAGAVPFGTFAAIVALWFGINVPLTIVGGWIGVKKGPFPLPPSRSSQIPRQIPPRSSLLSSPLPTLLLSGSLPFFAGFFELSQLLKSIFGAKVFYAFGFLSASTVVVGGATALVSVLGTYALLCREDYRWHWHSLSLGSSSALYTFFYGLLFWSTRLHLTGVANKVLYVGYLVLIASLQGVVLGSVGFVSAAVFVRAI